MENIREKEFHDGFISDMANDSAKKATGVEKGKDVMEYAMYSELQLSLKSVFILLIFVVNIINCNFFLKQTEHLGPMSITRLWSIVDLVIITINIIIVVTNFFDIIRNDRRRVISISTLRVLESFVILFMWFKSLYYLQLIP